MIELKRRFYDYLAHWRAHKHQECLLVKGARQIGKTYVIEKFGRENYAHFVEINFIFSPEFISVFDGDIRAEALFTKISAVMQEARFEPGKTLLFLDEIQECPNARTALKTLALSDRCDVIASGSLLGIRYKRPRSGQLPRSIAVGYERQVTMHSLSFEEFLWAMGYGAEQIDYLEGFLARREIVPEAVNARFHELLRQYVVVGGMPAVVVKFLEMRHYGDVQSVQEKILAAMSDDIRKYADKTDIPKIEDCYQAIPRILALENRKFKYSEVEKNGSARKYLDCIAWLNAANLSSPCRCVRSPEVGLSGYVREDWFKLYLSDVGLLMCRYGMLAKRQVLDGTLAGAIKGGIYENLVAGMLERNGIPLYYYKTESGDIEMEFITETEDGVVPLEVKAKTGATRSLDKLLSRDAIPYGFKFTGGNVGVTGKKVTLPHYLAMFVRGVKAMLCVAALGLALGADAAAELHGRVTGLERISAKNARGAEVRAWSGACWRNERVHAPFVVWGDGVDALRAEVGALVGPGGATIPARVRWVGEVLVDDRPHGAKVDPVRYPPYLSGDILDAAMPFRLTDAGYRALWVSARTPAEAGSRSWTASRTARRSASCARAGRRRRLSRRRSGASTCPASDRAANRPRAPFVPRSRPWTPPRRV